MCERGVELELGLRYRITTRRTMTETHSNQACGYLLGVSEYGVTMRHDGDQVVLWTWGYVHKLTRLEPNVTAPVMQTLGGD